MLGISESKNAFIHKQRTVLSKNCRNFAYADFSAGDTAGRQRSELRRESGNPANSQSTTKYGFLFLTQNAQRTLPHMLLKLILENESPAVVIPQYFRVTPYPCNLSLR